MELRENVHLDLGVCCRRQGDPPDAGDELAQLTQSQKVAAKVMAPLADAVRLIHHRVVEQGTLVETGDEGTHRTGGGSFRRDVKNPDGRGVRVEVLKWEKYLRFIFYMINF